MSTRLALRIQSCFDRLTPGERRLAELILEGPDDMLSFSATELSAMAGVSKSTAARFFRTLGYTDFNEVRLQAREERNRTGPVQHIVATGGQAATGTPGSIENHLRGEIANVIRTLEGLSTEVVERAVDALATAPRLWIVGQGGLSGLGSHARQLLARIRPEVWVLGAAPTTLAEDMAMVAPHDAALIISGRPRDATVRQIADFLAAARARVVEITDPVNASRAMQNGAIVLPCHLGPARQSPSLTAIVSVLQLLIDRVEAQLGRNAVRRSELIAQIHEELGDLEVY
ncbi:MurR/RpiR family transcriptional regulator [Radicibacter daui]|uniref:MurR/RpiR family transcriptional regulator n=1 Tax=Radicibacter daui TaxID=3064829 RepID=UPI004046DD14